MIQTYRDIDYRVYAVSSTLRHVISYYAPLNYYRNAAYGRGAIAFYFPGIKLVKGSGFVGTPLDVVNKLDRDAGYDKYIRGHIINSYLKGEIIKEKLVPLTSAANRHHSTVENRIRGVIDRMGFIYQTPKHTDEIYALGYEVNVNADMNGIPIGIEINWSIFSLSSVTGNLNTSPAIHARAISELYLSNEYGNYPTHHIINN